MTTQATPDFNTMLADQRKATETAQALANQWQEFADWQRARLDALWREVMTIREERDGLMSRLGEAIQTIMVKEGL